MKTQTNLKAGGFNNHNETLSGGLKLRTNLKAGAARTLKPVRNQN